MVAAVCLTALAWGVAAPLAAAQRCGDVAGDTESLDAAWTLIEQTCGCAPAQSESWKPGYKEFVSCARSLAVEAVFDGALRSKCRSTLISGVRRSTCERPPEWTTCCLTSPKGKTSCKVRKHVDQCATAGSRFAEPGATGTCLNACANAAGPECWQNSECDDGDGCTIDWCELADGCQNVPIEGCVPGGGGGGSSCTGTGSPTHGLSSVETALFQAINAHRISQGVAPVTACSSLNRSSQDHANDMRDQSYFSHVGANGSEFWERACYAGYAAGCGPLTWMGEIIAGHDSTAEGALNQWLGSPGHASILTFPNYVVAGLGHACGGPLDNYWVMNFAGANEASCD